MSSNPPPGQPAYVLHSRAYRETSALVDFLTPQGRLRAVLRSARGKAGTLARPFVPLEVEFRGQGELKNVGRMESAGVSTWLNGEALFSGLYLNELLIRLLPAEDPHPGVFDHYAATLLALAEGRPLEPLLRSFEWRLLDDLGYGFALNTDIHGEPIAPDGLYRLQVDAGLERVYLLQPGLFNGTELLAMAEADWTAPGALSAAKRLMRQAWPFIWAVVRWSVVSCFESPRFPVYAVHRIFPLFRSASVTTSNRILLGVNIDHVATLRQARGTRYPDPVKAALDAEEAGADGITVHLREDRRHIQERDVLLLKDVLQTRMNFEMGVTEEMMAFAERIRPAHICLVPETRQELTTEGGLDVAGQEARIKAAVERLSKIGCEVSLFIDADERQIAASQSRRCAGHRAAHRSLRRCRDADRSG